MSALVATDPTSRLPMELHLEILGELEGHRKYLRRARLVCRTWNIAATEILSRTTSHACLEFISPKERQRFASKTRELTLGGFFSWPYIVDSLRSDSDGSELRFPQLKRLTLGWSSRLSQESTRQFFGPDLKSLTVERMNNQLLTYVPSLCKSLKELQIGVKIPGSGTPIISALLDMVQQLPILESLIVSEFKVDLGEASQYSRFGPSLYRFRTSDAALDSCSVLALARQAGSIFSNVVDLEIRLEDPALVHLPGLFHRLTSLRLTIHS
ncbi:hypothetical protein K470DRAFT_90725 [Piedraia hortae CBS 480.64]|uniref:F-box domain-containing protein n=1 Tax=Piedraia hortae CBS 480.64 TaxID=1314780 RepID=A0A6A7BYN3_9PEZI|nr:hypothetical protein K470DRAFT_90725 [Piedraia hortae CBS 480.64]